MKKIIAKVLAAAAVVSAIAACPVMARYDAVCTHPELRTQDLPTYSDNGNGTHHVGGYYREWCNDCGYEEIVPYSDDTAHSFELDYVSYIYRDGKPIPVYHYKCCCGAEDEA